MPDIVRLRYLGPGTVTVPVIGGQKVKADCIVDFPGRVLTEHPADGPDAKPRPVPEDADYVLIESGNPPQIRAWQKSLWRNETPASTFPTAPEPTAPEPKE